MKTVRLSRQLKWDITKAAEKKFDNANPSKAEPEDGYAALLRLGILDKTNKMKTSFHDIWGFDMPMRTVNYVKLTCDYTNEDGYDKYTSLTMPTTTCEVPRFITSYDTVELDVSPTDADIVAAYQVQTYNDDLRQKRRDHTLKLSLVMDRFSTLNQLLKAAPYIKDLVPQGKITKMHEVDDRSGRRAALAEIANDELQDLRETLLEDALLGDD
jgi:hypothetical protein